MGAPYNDVVSDGKGSGVLPSHSRKPCQHPAPTISEEMSIYPGIFIQDGSIITETGEK